FSIAVPGTTPRCWYYMLRAADPGARRYAAIVIPFDTYDDRTWEDLRGRESDLRYLAPLTGFADLFDLALSYPEWRLRAPAAQMVLFKGLVYGEDFQDLLVRHKWRLLVASDVKSRRSGWRYDAAWDNGSLSGLAADWTTEKIHVPERIAPDQRAEI